MKKFSIIVALLLVAATFASAELLVTANPIGQGKWAGLLGYISNSNAGGANSTVTAATYAGYVGYGINEKLDLYANYGSTTAANLPLGISSLGGTAYGLTLKYQVMAEGANSPVSVALAAGTRLISQNVGITGVGSFSANGNQALIGVGVSKVMAPFVPYGGLAYRSNGGDIGTASQIDATIGSAIAWSTQGAVFVEYTLQSITPNGSANYSNGQIGIGVGYSM